MTVPLPSSPVLISRQLPSPVQEPLVPSINFAMVCPGVYRSGYPTRKNYHFLRALRLRTILYLCPEEYAESNVKFCEENNINVLRFATEGNKEPFMDISETLMHRILSALTDTRTHPVLIHCNKGKHRTGTVVACLRLLQGWSLVSIFQEYRCFAGDKARMGDQQYVELYHPIVLVTPPHVADWLCITQKITVVQTEKELLEMEANQLGWSLVAPTPPLPTPEPSAPMQKQPEAPLSPSSSPKWAPQSSLKESATQQQEHPNSDTTKLPTKYPAATSSSGAITTTAASRRSGGHAESGTESGKIKEITTNSAVPRKENGDGKKKYQK